MYIDAVPNRKSPPAILLRESYRDENGKVKKRTLANLSQCSAEVIDGLKALLKGGANPMTLSELGGTPLHEAATGGSTELIELLLEYKVDPSIKSKEGVTALDLAKEYKNDAAIEALSKGE